MNKLYRRTIFSRADGNLSHGPTPSAGRLRSSNNQRTRKNLQLFRHFEPEAETEIHELPIEPRSAQPPIESAPYPTTSDAVSEPAGEMIELPAANERETLSNPTELGNPEQTTETGGADFCHSREQRSCTQTPSYQMNLDPRNYLQNQQLPP